MDLPESYEGETWLKPVEENAKIPTILPKTEAIDRSENPQGILLKGKKPRPKAK